VTTEALRAERRKPRLLDLFCGAGGAGMGYHRAGFDVVGVDIEPHPDYPFEFHQADALTYPLDGFDAYHASPPCPRYSSITPEHRREEHPDLVGPVRERLEATGRPYVIENVVGAPLLNPLMLCGSSFGLRVRRHRLFESNVWLMSLPCAHGNQQAVGVYGDHWDREGGWTRPDGSSRGVKATSVADAQDALGIDWMRRWEDLADAIPPVFTEFIGEQLAAHLAQSDLDGVAS
jgi:DNA (cytosine-5)-methyltransferase 1